MRCLPEGLSRYVLCRAYDIRNEFTIGSLIPKLPADKHCSIVAAEAVLAFAMNKHEQAGLPYFRLRTAAARRAVYNVLDHGGVGHPGSIALNRGIVILITINLAAVTLESVPNLRARFAPWFTALESISLIAFSVEYLLRVWIAPEHAPYRHLGPRRARMKFITSALGIIDLLAVLPFWFAFVLPADLRVLLVFRIVRFLKLVRYSPGIRSLLEALQRERRALFGCFVILLGAALVAASIMHIVEGNVQPDKFGTIPDAMWWAIVTLGTIGYGDVVPVTVLGRMVASVTIFAGLIMIALPVGIIASAFSDEVHRRDFVVTWSMLARVPLFAELQASDIADIMSLLRAQRVEPGSFIVRRGERAHCMYFIADGEVDVVLKDRKVQLGTGDFFGEIAALRRSRRTATVIARTQASLLVLDAHDLHALMERDPRIAEHIRHVASTRLGEEIIVPKGDIVLDEIEKTSRRNY
jgi:voltage-gated potassium channel